MSDNNNKLAGVKLREASPPGVKILLLRFEVKKDNSKFYTVSRFI